MKPETAAKGYFYSKAGRVVEDWVKKISHKIVELARQSQYAVAREDLTNLVEGLRELPRERGVGPLIPSYRRLEFWIGWQAEKLGVPVAVVEPRGTSSTCPKCGSRPAENGYRRMKRARCRL